MGKKPSTENSENEVDEYALAMTFMERLNRYPAIESVALSEASIPNGGNSRLSGYKFNSDSINNMTLRQRYVTSSFFDVFKMKVDGKIFDWTDNNDNDNAIISPFSEDKYGGYANDKIEYLPISEVKTLRYEYEWDQIKKSHKVIGRTAKIKDSYFKPYMSNIIMPLERSWVNLQNNQITVRVKPDADKDFIEKFTKDMREQLFIGPYYLSSMVSIKELGQQMDALWGARDQMYSAYAITLFLVINIFLGILGSFWFRTQTRRSEIGLRIALGSPKRKVQSMIIIETILLLLVASIIATIICLNLSDPQIIYSLGIPTVDKEEWGIGSEQNIINFVITFGFLALVSIIAVWYPAQQAANTQPAEALHDE